MENGKPEGGNEINTPAQNVSSVNKKREPFRLDSL
jgi:hypothetical protein